MIEKELSVIELFEQARHLKPDEQSQFIDRHTQGDASLRTSLEKLLSVGKEAGQFFDELLSPFNDFKEKTLGPYRLIRLLGQGGMGIVYAATRNDGIYDREVAIKLLPLAGLDPHLHRRFAEERNILANLQHDNIASMFDANISDDNVPFIVMELIEGEAVDTYCDTNTLSIDSRLTIFSQICDAVSYAHQRLVIHRDLKPENILVNKEGNAKLLDFGIAKIADKDNKWSSNLTENFNENLLSKKYAAPEQWRREPVDTQTDIYALGVLLSKLLCGAVTTTDEAIRRLAVDEAYIVPPPNLVRTWQEGKHPESTARSRGLSFRQMRAMLDGELHSIVAKAMAFDRDKRYISVDAFKRDIVAFQRGEVVDAQRVTSLYKMGKWLRRNYAPVAIGTAFCLLSFGVAVKSYENAKQAERHALAMQLERNNSEQVTSLLVSILGSADPANSNAADVTARDLLANGRLIVLENKEIPPIVRARLLTLIGSVYKNYGLHQEAEEPLRQALHDIESLPKIEYATQVLQDTKIQATSTLGDALLGQGKYDEAHISLLQAIGLAKNAYGETDVRVLRALNGIAELHFHQRNHDEGYTVAKQAASLANELDTNNDVRATSYTNLAAISYFFEAPTEVVPIMERALQLFESSLPSNHPKIGRAKANLAATLVSLGKREQAAVYYQEVIDVSHTQPNFETENYVQATYGLGVILLSQGDSTLAKSFLREAVRVSSKLKEPDDYGVLLTQFMLGVTEYIDGNSELAYEIFTRIKKTVDEHHINSSLAIRVSSQMASINFDQESFSQAEVLLNNALQKIDSKNKPPAARLIAFTRAMQGRVLVQTGVDSGKDLITNALTELREAYGDNYVVANMVQTWLENE